LQRIVHVAQRHAHALGFHAVHLDVKLRHARGERREDLGKSWCLAAVDHHAEGRARERVQPDVGAVLNHHLEARSAAQSLYRRGRQHEHERVAQLLIARVELAQDGPRGFLRLLAILEILKRNEHRSGIGQVGSDQ
jgi:hypothetical protein